LPNGGTKPVVVSDTTPFQGGNCVSSVTKQLHFLKEGTLRGGEEIKPGILHGGEEIRPGVLHVKNYAPATYRTKRWFWGFSNSGLLIWEGNMRSILSLNLLMDQETVPVLLLIDCLLPVVDRKFALQLVKNLKLLKSDKKDLYGMGRINKNLLRHWEIY